MNRLCLMKPFLHRTTVMFFFKLLIFFQQQDISSFYLLSHFLYPSLSSFSVLSHLCCFLTTEAVPQSPSTLFFLVCCHFSLPLLSLLLIPCLALFLLFLTFSPYRSLHMSLTPSFFSALPLALSVPLSLSRCFIEHVNGKMIGGKANDTAQNYTEVCRK